jgi:hypothetical protein
MPTNASSDRRATPYGHSIAVLAETVAIGRRHDARRPVARDFTQRAPSLRPPENGSDRPERGRWELRERLVPPAPTWYIFGVARSSAASDSTVARTIRFPAALRQKITSDAERCGRSFEGQVIALLRRHYGEDVDIAPSPVEILALATASMADIAPADARSIERKLKAGDR